MLRSLWRNPHSSSGLRLVVRCGKGRLLGAGGALIPPRIFLHLLNVMMDTFHRLYLRLTLVQGLSLALATGLTIQWLHWSGRSAPEVAVHSVMTGESARFLLDVGSAWKGGIAIFLGTWGIAAGVTGWIIMKEQRDQMLALLQKHDTAAAPDLHLVAEEEPEFSPPEPEELESLRELAVVPAPFRLRLAASEESPWQDAESTAPRRPRLALRPRPEA